MKTPTKEYQFILNNKCYHVNIKKKKIKRIIIRVDYSNSINVSCPERCSYDDALKSLNHHQDWIEKAIKKQEENIKNMYIEECVNMTKVWFQGMLYNIIETKDINTLYKITANNIYINGSKEKAIDDIRKSLYPTIEEEFNRCLNGFKQHISQTPFLEIKKMKSRWGSCNFKTGRIVINKMLVHVPVELLQYVMVHEFVHFFHPNHSKNFHSFLNQCLPNNKILEKSLKKYSFLLRI